MKLIDKRELMKLLDDMFSRYDGTPSVMEGFKYGLDAVISEVSVMPTIDAEPVRHGKWVLQYRNEDICGREMYCIRQCSLCETYYRDVGHVWNYCPNCGAKMDIGEEE